MSTTTNSSPGAEATSAVSARPSRRKAKDAASTAALLGGDPQAMVARLAASMPGLVPPPKMDVGAVRPTIHFETEPNSPFPDGYSIAGERKALADLLEAENIPEDHPLMPRLELLDERERTLRRMQHNFKHRSGADGLVPTEQALGIKQIGGLVDEEADSMTLHTKEGYRLFMGRARAPDGSYSPIVGGKRIASALRTLWMLTGTDNPYADWALVRHEQNLAMLLQRLDDETAAAQAGLDGMKRKGLNYTILMSAVPKTMELGFKSPYGYSAAELVVSYDYFVRVIKTLGRKNLKSDDQVRKAIREMTRVIRRCWNETARFERWLIRDEIRDLARADFMPGADAQAGKRVEAASNIFGAVPEAIFAARLVPRHSRRRQQLTPAEQRLLQEVGAELSRVEATAGASKAETTTEADVADATAEGLV
jgi:integrating conjugative element protein (TIGR03761 family)